MNYGVPYMGSKNKIVAWVVRNLPAGRTLYDIFAGGCAVTHRAMVEHKYDRFVVNDINDTPKLFADAVNGCYRDEKRWISREDFARLKDSDPYVRTCWSFGNNGDNYMYSREVEPWKRALHYARVYGDRGEMQKFGIDSDGSRGDIVAHKDEYKAKYVRWYISTRWEWSEEYEKLVAGLKEKSEKNKEALRAYLVEALRASGLTQAEVQRRLGTQMAGHYFGRSQWEFPTREYYDKMREFMPLAQSYDEVYGLQEYYDTLQSLESLESLEILQSLERLQRLQSLQRLQRLQRLQSDYASLAFDDPLGVIYCDPPYKGTAGYNGTDFDHEAFYDWCQRQTLPLVISEYDMPDGFVCIAETTHRSRLSGTANNEVTERLFAPKGNPAERRIRQYEQLTLFNYASI